MALKHVHFVTSGSFLEIVKRLQVKLGLTSRTALIMYCVTRIADQEGVTRDGVLMPKGKAGSGNVHSK
jgi:hypothetical protein